jgi:TPP-dependent pyruvate/acetoin dehydrogenase alpha subunit
MTPIREEASVERLADRGCAYGIPGVVIDGNDVEAVFDATVAAATRARAGEGPTLIEAITYRLTGHMFGDTQPYRSQDEVESWRAKEPLVVTRERLRGRGVADEVMAGVDAEVESEIQAAIAFARQSPEPRREEAMAHVYT